MSSNSDPGLSLFATIMEDRLEQLCSIAEEEFSNKRFDKAKEICGRIKNYAEITNNQTTRDRINKLCELTKGENHENRA